MLVFNSPRRGKLWVGVQLKANSTFCIQAGASRSDLDLNAGTKQLTLSICCVLGTRLSISGRQKIETEMVVIGAHLDTGAGVWMMRARVL